MLTAGCRWDKPELKTAFCQGLNSEVLTELAWQDDKVSLDYMIEILFESIMLTREELAQD